MGSGRFYALLSTLLFAAVCAYAGTAIFTALDYVPGETPTAPAVSGDCELHGIIIRREEIIDTPIGLAAGERIPAGDYCKESALFFPESDGYEHISPADVSAMSAETLKELMQSGPAQKSGAKLIFGFDCYYAAFYSGHENIEPGSCRIRFEGESESRRAEMIHISKEDGDCTMLFRLMLDRQLAELRICNAQLIY